MHEVKLGAFAFGLPACRDDLTVNQGKIIALERLRLETTRARMRVLARLVPRKAQKLLKQVDGVAMAELGDLMKWIWNEKEVEGLDSIKPLVRGFRYRRQYYAFPQEDFADVTIEEWAYVSHEMQMLRNDPENSAEYLLNLVATISRPLRSKKERKAKLFDGYQREYFNPERVEQSVQRFKNIPAWVYAVAQDFCLRISQMIVLRYHDVFEGESSGTDGGFGWPGMMMSVAEGGVFGNYDQVKQKNMHDILLYASKRAKEEKKRIAQLEKQKLKRR